MKIGTIINFCSNDSKFLPLCIEQAKIFSDNIHVVACDHFFDGTPEDVQALQKSFSSFSDVKFYIYPFIKEGFHAGGYQKKDEAHFYHSLSRFVGCSFLDTDIDYVLFLDVDEIVEGQKFADWLKNYPLQNFSAITLANYWYFRSAANRAQTWEDSVVLAKKSFLQRKILLHKDERPHIFSQCKGEKQKFVTGPDGQPMIHHYSWVRSKEEMIKKVSSWGHKQDRDWIKLVEEEFSHPFSGKDFVHGYEFDTVAPFADLEKKIVHPAEKKSPVILIEKQRLKKMVEGGFFLFSLAKKTLDLNH